MDPALLPAMRDALGEILAGRQPEQTDGNVASHEFDGFSVLTDAKGAVG
jgi:hypothetical protein